MDWYADNWALTALVLLVVWNIIGAIRSWRLMRYHERKLRELKEESEAYSLRHRVDP